MRRQPMIRITRRPMIMMVRRSAPIAVTMVIIPCNVPHGPIRAFPNRRNSLNMKFQAGLIGRCGSNDRRGHDLMLNGRTKHHGHAEQWQMQSAQTALLYLRSRCQPRGGAARVMH
jgi:hypothetical protein